MARIVDLFSGAGGMTFGFYYKQINDRFVKNKSNEFVFANEYDKAAASAFRINFPDIPLIEGDIAKVVPNLLNEMDIDYSDIDIVIGGPPCQSYSTVGRRQYDQRAKMYKEYVRLLNFLRPKVFVFENVKGLLSMKDSEGQPVIKDIQNTFEAIDDKFGYELNIKILNALEFGVPQNRERVFIVGIRKDLPNIWTFPESKIAETSCYLTIEDAISDLPKVENGKSAKKANPVIRNDYQKLMRNGNNEITDHKSRIYGDKISTIIVNLSEGESKNDINHKVDVGLIGEKYRLTSGFNNTYGRLWWKRPSTTITNNFGTPSGLRCIHPRQNRALTIREAARIQSFPDFIKFDGTIQNKHSQVGNAVPPLLALSVSEQIEITLKGMKNDAGK